LFDKIDDLIDVLTVPVNEFFFFLEDLLNQLLMLIAQLVCVITILSFQFFVGGHNFLKRGQDDDILGLELLLVVLLLLFILLLLVLVLLLLWGGLVTRSGLLVHGARRLSLLLGHEGLLLELGHLLLLLLLLLRLIRLLLLLEGLLLIVLLRRLLLLVLLLGWLLVDGRGHLIRRHLGFHAKHALVLHWLRRLLGLFGDALVCKVLVSKGILTLLLGDLQLRLLLGHPSWGHLLILGELRA
jgi:hypothetical protein